MTLKTSSSPLDRLTLAEWRQSAAVWLGLSAWTDIDSVLQTEVERFLNEAHDSISKRAAHYPWGTRETTKTVSAGTDTTYAMPADFRHHVSIVEETSTAKTVASVSDHESFMLAHDGTSAHPWTYRNTPVWFFDGMDDSAPPVQQWRRVGAGNSGATARIRYRPMFGLLNTSGSDQFTDLPAPEVGAIRAKFFLMVARFRGDTEKVAIWKDAMEEAIAENEINDHVTTETPYRLGVDSAFRRETL